MLDSKGCLTSAFRDADSAVIVRRGEIHDQAATFIPSKLKFQDRLCPCFVFSAPSEVEECRSMTPCIETLPTPLPPLLLPFSPSSHSYHGGDPLSPFFVLFVSAYGWFETCIYGGVRTLFVTGFVWFLNVPFGFSFVVVVFVWPVSFVKGGFALMVRFVAFFVLCLFVSFYVIS